MKAEFKTAHLQRELVLDTKVSVELEVGDLVEMDGESGLKKSEVLAVGNYIIAQSDMTMEYGHVPVENQDWRYSPKVAVSAENKKKVAVYRVNNVDDIITREDA